MSADARNEAADIFGQQDDLDELFNAEFNVRARLSGSVRPTLLAFLDAQSISSGPSSYLTISRHTCRRARLLLRGVPLGRARRPRGSALLTRIQTRMLKMKSRRRRRRLT